MTPQNISNFTYNSKNSFQSNKLNRMAQNYDQHDVPRSDEESATNNNVHSQDRLMRKKRRMKCVAYVALFAVFQAIIILDLALIVMRVRMPKVRLDEVTVTNDGSGTVRLTARVLLKNTNFGRYKFDSGVAIVSSGGSSVGQFAIPNGRARARSSKKAYVNADLRSSSVNSGALALNVEARLRGKVRLMKVIKRTKSANMNCTMIINLSTSSVYDLRC